VPYRFFSADGAAQYLHLSRADLDRLVKDREVPFETRGARTVFRKHDLDGWASRRLLDAGSGRQAGDWQRTCALVSGEPLLPDLIRPEQIDPAMRAKTKASVLRDLVAVAEATGWVCDPAELIASLEAREALCSTAVPGGVAFLHPRTQQADRFTTSFLVLGRTVQPIHYGAPDGQPTDLFFLLGCQEDRLHLHTLARLCLMAQKTDLLTQLRGASDSTAMCAALLADEQAVVGRGDRAGVSIR